jgi:hypothetical protein
LVAAVTRTSTLIVCESPTALELAFLQHPQQLHLERRAHRSHFVEEERAFVRLLQASLAIADRARERAADVARRARLRAGLPESRCS